MWKPFPGGALLDDQLFVSFQRFPRPRYHVEIPPSSWGALPCGCVASGHLCIPVWEQEAVWIGLASTGGSQIRVSAAAETATELTDVVTGEPTISIDSVPKSVDVPPFDAFNGIVRKEGGWWPFVRLCDQGPCRPVTRIRLYVDHAHVLTRAQVEFVSPEDFTTSEGAIIQPLNLADGYKGWRLP